MSITPLLNVSSVTKKFDTPQGTLTILDGASCTIQAGEMVAIVGPSGSGKSTLLSLLGLLDTPSSGNIELQGRDISKLSTTEQARLRNEAVGFIFQSFELISPFTVAENIAAPFEIGGQAPNRSTIDTLIEQVGLTHRRDALPHTLSGGEKQRVAIARALARTPALILADEPTGSLDRTTGDRVLTLLLDAVQKRGSTLVVITHDESIAAKMDRVFEIRDKKLYERG